MRTMTWQVLSETFVNLQRSTMFSQITPSWIFINIFSSKGDNSILLASEDLP